MKALPQDKTSSNHSNGTKNEIDTSYASHFKIPIGLISDNVKYEQ